MKLLTTAPLGLLLLAGFCLSDGHFGYGEDNGPSTWGVNFPTCSGKRQSPINIDKRDVIEKKLPSLELCGKNLHNMKIENNGHTVMLKSTESEDLLPIIMGGPLDSATIYKFVQLHFHWGKDNSQGSETTIDNKSFPMELHAVFYNLKYGTFNEAAGHEDGLAVVGYMYEVNKDRKLRRSKSENKILEPVTRAINEGLPEGQDMELKNFRLLEFLNLETSPYYTYNGSLTTPPCSEVVTWIVLQKCKYLSNKQIAVFRQVKTQHGDLTHNFRPVQDRNGRKVWRNSGSIPDGDGSGQCSKKLVSPLIPTLMGLLAYSV